LLTLFPETVLRYEILLKAATVLDHVEKEANTP